MKILAIDDEQLSHDFIQHVLKNEHTVAHALDGEQGLKLARDMQPDLIILDVRMPGMDGYTVCKQLKQDLLTAAIPVMFLSANTSLDEQMQGYNAGGNDYLVKPIEPATLLAKVNVMLRYREQQTRLANNYDEAHKTAMIAMIGSSETGMAMQFMESSFLLHDYAELARAFFTFTNKLHLVCAVMFFTTDGPRCFFFRRQFFTPGRGVACKDARTTTYL